MSQTGGRGGILTGMEIIKQCKEGRIEIDPLLEANVGPNSVDVRLADRLAIYIDNDGFPIDSHGLSSKVSRELGYLRRDCDSLESVDLSEGLARIQANLDRLGQVIDSKKGTPGALTEKNLHWIDIPPQGVVLLPGVPYLGMTMECVGSEHYVPIMEGRSTCGRLFLSPYHSAGFGDLGFIGTWTLEITAMFATRVYPGQRIAQLGFWEPSGSREIMYGEMDRSKYQGQMSPTPYEPDVIDSSPDEEE